MNKNEETNADGLPVLGIDIGRVIINALDESGHEDTAFLNGGEEAAMCTPASEGAFEAIAALTDLFEGRVWLVSKCGPRIQQRSKRWLARNQFHETTGVHPDRVRFCLKRPQKRDHCLAIGATHFVDDRLDVLRHLRGVVPNLYWFGHQRKGPESVPWAQRTQTWADAFGSITAQLHERQRHERAS